MKQKIAIILLFISNLTFGQTGINTDNPKVNLHVKSDSSNLNSADGIIAPILSGNEARDKDPLYGANQTGTIVYVTSVPTPSSPKTVLITEEGYYYFDGTLWRAFADDIEIVHDAKRFLGGTVYVRFQSVSIDNTYVPQIPFNADNLISGTYQVGTVTETASRGGVAFVRGDGFKISNPSRGVFDIEFDIEFTEIYGISTNILDAYGQGSQGSTSTGDYPTIENPGNTLKTTDNTQVAYISNKIIRVKTGDQYGGSSNRPFTFLITGK